MRLFSKEDLAPFSSYFLLFSVLLPSQSMKMAIYYEIYARLNRVEKNRDVAISSNLESILEEG